MNKYRSLQVDLSSTAQPLRDGAQNAPVKGYRGDITPGIMPLDSSPAMDNVRFEGVAIRKDFGFSFFSDSEGAILHVPGKTITLGEHKFLSGGEVFHRIFRGYIENNKLQLEIWDGADWIRVDSSIPDALNVLLSTVSSQSLLMFADGQRILVWTETPALSSSGIDFFDSSIAPILIEEGDANETVDLVSGGVGDEYEVNYSVFLEASPDADATIIIRFQVLTFSGTQDLGTRVYFAAAGATLNEPHEVFSFIHGMEDGGTVILTLEEVNPDPVQVSDNLIAGATYDLEAALSAPASPTGTMEVFFDADAPTGWIELEFLLKISGVWTVVSGPTQFFDGPGQSVILAGDPNATEVAIHKTDDSAGGAAADHHPQLARVEWTHSNPLRSEVKPFNLAVDGDPAQGVTFQVLGAPVSTLDLLSVNAPGARYIFPFGDRLIALGDGEDKQSLAWSADGDLTDWIGPGSGQIFLLDAKSDAIDGLISGAGLGNNMFALFRQRSIWRGFETGNVEQAVGVVPWVEGLGTEYPFSIRIVTGGIIFLGHDLMVYYLTEAGPTKIGQAIHLDLIRTLTSNYEMVDTAFDAVFGEYFLGIPEDGAQSITKVWIFDLAHFLSTQEPRWRSREMSVDRLVSVSHIE